jgi:hypothetical protein
VAAPSFPAAHEDRGDRADVGIEPGLDAALDGSRVRLGGSEILAGGEEQCHVDRHAGEDRLLDRPQAGFGARNLDEQVRTAALCVQTARLTQGRLRIVGEQRRDLKRDEPIDAAGAAMDRREHVGGRAQVIESQLEERGPAVGAGGPQSLYGLVVGRGSADGLVVDRRV